MHWWKTPAQGGKAALFCRQQRAGWHVYGNEIRKFRVEQLHTAHSERLL